MAMLVYSSNFLEPRPYGVSGYFVGNVGGLGRDIIVIMGVILRTLGRVMMIMES